MCGKTQASIYNIKLYGPLRVFDRKGCDVSPRSAKAQGLLAMLIMARGEPIHRNSLQSRLWSDRMQAQARASLKQALSELRRCFHGAHDPVLQTTGGPVSINMDLVSCDVFEPFTDDLFERQEFLAGLDVRDEEFEDWLRATRRRLELTQQRSRVAAPPSEPERLTIRFAPVEHGSTADIDTIVGEALAATIQSALLEQDFFPLTHFTGQGHVEVRLSLMPASDGECCANILVVALHSSEILWHGTFSGTPTDFAGRRGVVFSVSTAHQIIDRCFALSQGDQIADMRASRLMRQGIDQMLRVGSESLAAAEQAFATAVNLDSRASYLAWQAYLNAFLYEKSSFGPNVGPMWGHTEELARKALDADRHNPQVCALLAHLFGFVRRDFERAHAILEPLESTTNSLMLQDSLALFYFYTGDLTRAVTHARAASMLGERSPYRYLFTTTLAMIQLVQGHFEGAWQMANQAIAQHPIGSTAVFEPALRTLAAAQAHSGYRVEAAKTLDRIRTQTPDFTLSALESPERAPIPNPKAFQLIKSGLEIANAV